MNLIKRFIAWWNKPPEPYVPETWNVISYEKYIDDSYGMRIRSILYEAVSTKNRRISTHIYQSNLTSKQIEELLNSGQKVGAKYDWKKL